MVRARTRAATHLDDVDSPLASFQVLGHGVEVKEARVGIFAEALRIGSGGRLLAPRVGPSVAPGVEGELVRLPDITRDGAHGAVEGIEERVNRAFVVVAFQDVAVMDGYLLFAFEWARENPSADDELNLSGGVVGSRIECCEKVH